MLLLIDKKFTEVHPLLNSAGHHVENWQGSPHQKEYLKVYFLVLQVCHYLMAGQVRIVRKISICKEYSMLILTFIVYETGEKCKTLSETIATEYTDYYVTQLANR